MMKSDFVDRKRTEYYIIYSMSDVEIGDRYK